MPIDKIHVSNEDTTGFELYHPTQLALAVGERIRVTAIGKTKHGKHRLSKGALLTVE